MKRFLGIVLMIVGVVSVACSVMLYISNRNEDKQAQELTEYYLPQLIETIRNSTNSESSVQDNVSDGSQNSNGTVNNNDMPVFYIDEQGFVGYLSIPSLNLELPIMSETDYDKLQMAPCRFYGSAKTDNLIVGAHNYSKHFGEIGNLNAKDEVYVTDMDGVVYKYSVVSIDIIQPYAVDILTNEEYDLVLFTCTYSGKNRIAVGCDRIQ